jgi:hypothetical protein
VNQVSLRRNSIVRTLGLIVVLLATASFGGQIFVYTTGHKTVHGLIHLFDLDAERNIPTFFSACLILICALLLATISSLKSNHKEHFTSHWKFLAGWFLFMAIDENASIHEMLIAPMHKLLGGKNLGLFYFSWVIPGIVVVVLLATLFLRFWLRLPRKTRLAFLLAAITYISGVIGFEMIGGYYAELHGKENLIYNVFVTIEESLEMTGLIIFIGSLIGYIADNYYEVQLQFSGGFKK